MSLENVHGYPVPVWSRFERPDLAGSLDGDGVIRARAGSPAARGVLELALRRQGDRAEARFLAHGCPVTIAVGQWLAETLENGMPSVPPDAAQIRAALEITEDKAHCALMGEDVIRALWKQMR
jgi:NifU-like protein involved in Fe-S cluster formation